MKSIHKSIVLRLLLGCLLVAVLASGFVIYLGLDKVDQRVMSLATQESSQFTQENLRHFNQPEVRVELEKKLHEFLSGHFVIVELYDRNKIAFLEDMDKDKESVENWLKNKPHGFPLGHDNYHRKLIHEGRLYLQVLVALREAPKQPVEGYFEGVYEVDDQTLGDILEHITLALSGVLVATLVTALLLYPFILFLLRELLRFSRDLLKANIELMEVLGSAIAKRDSDTNLHNYRVTVYAIRLAETVGLEHDGIRNLITGAFLHDVGKIGIPDAILLKPARLTPEEFEIMKTHTQCGVEIIGKSLWLKNARDVIEYHHEKFDGSGYPNGLKGDEIPLNARIFAVVDVFDALTSRRPYKAPLPLTETLAILREGSGSHFDPALVDLFTPIAMSLHARTAALSEAAIETVLADSLARYFFFTSRSIFEGQPHTAIPG